MVSEKAGDSQINGKIKTRGDSKKGPKNWAQTVSSLMASTLPGGGPRLAQRRKLTEIDGWRIVRKLGSGGMGVVYLAEKPQGILSSEILHQRVALKTFHPRLDRKRIAREIRAQSIFNHPNLIHYLGHGTCHGIFYLLMNHVQGMDCWQFTRAEDDVAEPLPVAEACAIAVEVAKGLSHIHKAGFVHRDVKPANIMISDEGSVVLGDLGLTDISGGNDGGGTPAFVAPEQARREDTDYRADIYSLGSSLYYLISGKTPFEEGSESWSLESNHAAAVPLAELVPGLPAGLCELVARMTEPRREDRPASCVEVIDILKPWSNEAQLQRLYKARQQGLETIVHDLTEDMLPQATGMERRSWLMFAGLGTGGLLAAMIASRGFGPKPNPGVVPGPAVEIQGLAAIPLVDEPALDLTAAAYRGNPSGRAKTTVEANALIFKPSPGRREMVFDVDLLKNDSLHLRLLPRQSMGACGILLEGAFGQIEFGFKHDRKPGRFLPFATKVRSQTSPPEHYLAKATPLQVDWNHGFGLSLRLKAGQLVSAQVAGLAVDLPPEGLRKIGFYSDNCAADFLDITIKSQKIAPPGDAP